VIYPTGAGEPRRLDRGSLENVESAQWFPNGDSILIGGNEPGTATRFYVQDLAGGPPRGATPPGTNSGKLSPDGKLVLAKGPDDKYFLYSLTGSEPRAVPWLSESESLIRWTADGRSVLVSDFASIPNRVERVDLETGRRTFYKEIAPRDRAGLMGVAVSFITQDERSYAYAFGRRVSTLFVVESKK
jgi:Tol biopolymer transport system component